MKKGARPILWTQGLFLQPQHFQQLDLYAQSLLFPYAHYVHPFFWGICDMQIAAGSLEHRLCEIERAEILFPDGTWAAFPGNSMLQPRSLKDVTIEPGRPFTVYVGLRKWRDGERNVSIVQSSEQARTRHSRYVSLVDPEEVEDLHGDGPLSQVQFMNLGLRLFWETEIDELGDYWLVPIAQLDFIDGTIKLSKNYTPPTISVAQSPILLQIVKNIREQVSSRATILEEYKTPGGIQFSHDEPYYILYILALRSLNRYIPLLHQITADPVVHPWDLFGTLRQLIGELSSFTERFNSLGVLRSGNRLLSDYDHEDLSKCFMDADILIGELLNSLSIGAQNIISLEKKGDIYNGQLPLDTLEGKNVFYMVIKAGGSESDILGALRHVAKVGSSERMPTLIARALPGISLQQSQIPPPGLPKRPQSYYFKFDQDNPEWFELRRTGKIDVYWPEAPADADIQVVIIRT